MTLARNRVLLPFATQSCHPHGMAAPQSTIFFRSHRTLSLRFVTLVCLVPVPLTLWLLSLSQPPMPLPLALGLTLLSALLPASLYFLHDRYVLELARQPDGALHVTTFLLWGRRQHLLVPGGEATEHAGEFHSLWAPDVNAPYLAVRLRSGRRLLLDRQGDAPHGWDAVLGVLRVVAS